MRRRGRVSFWWWLKILYMNLDTAKATPAKLAKKLCADQPELDYKTVLKMLQDIKKGD